MARKKRTPHDWTPRPEGLGFPWDVSAFLIVEDLKKSGASEAVAIGGVLEDMLAQGDLSVGLAEAILDNFEEWASGIRKQLERPDIQAHEVIDWLLNSNESEAIVIGEIFESMASQGDLSKEMAISIADEFEGWAQAVGRSIERWT